MLDYSRIAPEDHYRFTKFSFLNIKMSLTVCQNLQINLWKITPGFVDSSITAPGDQSRSACISRRWVKCVAPCWALFLKTLKSTAKTLISCGSQNPPNSHFICPRKPLFARGTDFYKKNMKAEMPNFPTKCP